MIRKKIILATNNEGKLQEFKNLLFVAQFEFFSAKNFSIPEIEETGLTFVENAILKARNAAIYAKIPAIADDSGLEVDALNGAPGVYSARYAGVNAKDEDNIAKLLQELKDVPWEKRTARFHCVIVYLRHELDPVPIICYGSLEGKILFEPRGKNGFGYDPVFFLEEFECSVAELPISVKNEISHRAKALVKLNDFLQKNLCTR